MTKISSGQMGHNQKFFQELATVIVVYVSLKSPKFEVLSEDFKSTNNGLIFEEVAFPSTKNLISLDFVTSGYMQMT